MNEDVTLRIKFIKEIERHPCLYDHFNLNYNNKKAIDGVWARIGKIFGEHGSDCKSKWRSIRSAYIRSINTKPNRPFKTYYLAHYLSFLNPFLRNKPPLSDDNLSAPEDEEPENFDAGNDLYHSVEVTPENVIIKEEPENELSENGNEEPNPLYLSEGRHLKRSPQFERSSTPNFNPKMRRTDELHSRSSCEHYALSLVPYIETMSERQQLAFQRGVIDLIERIKFGTCTGTETEKSHPP